MTLIILHLASNFLLLFPHVTPRGPHDRQEQHQQLLLESTTDSSHNLRSSGIHGLASLLVINFLGEVLHLLHNRLGLGPCVLYFLATIEAKWTIK